ncbi:unnamed protein product [Microthlaspi erraticum]|uniref:Retrotransposon gag domain-containing protein n=1 Tax=Microthlaspi erraticum TaxID=1685480 RepID=A0A6D2L2A8_9BRAS|nr:unnamed protein product [Microthlaspi erraticum]
MREVSDTLWNFHLTWRSKSDEIMLPSRAQAPHRVVLYDNRASIDDETNESNAIKRAATTQNADPPIHRQRNSEPAWKSDLRSSFSTKHKDLSDLFEMEQLEDEPLRSYLNRFKSALLDLRDIPGAPPIAEPVLVQALGNGLRYESGFWEDIRIRPSPTLKDAFLRAENYIASSKTSRSYGSTPKILGSG